MQSGVYWSCGKRMKNEDSLALESVETDGGEYTLLLVADGIASLDYGEEASGYVAECFVRWFYDYAIKHKNMNHHLVKRSLLKTTYECHRSLKEQARIHDVKWGSTCSLVCIKNHRFVCLQIGDSSVFKKAKNGNISKMSRSHTNEKGQLLKCIGSMKYDAPDIFVGRIRYGEGILVASDGFTEQLNNRDLEESLMLTGKVSEERIEKRLAALGAQIDKRGGSDNRSAIYVYRNRGRR